MPMTLCGNISKMVTVSGVVVGSTDKVRKRFTQCRRELGLGNLICLMHFGTLPRTLNERNLWLFTKEVLPTVQSRNDRDYQGFDPAKTVAL